MTLSLSTLPSTVPVDEQGASSTSGGALRCQLSCPPSGLAGTNRRLGGAFLAGFLSAVLLALAVAKGLAWSQIRQDELALGYAAAGVGELVVGAALAFWPGHGYPWMLGSVLALGLVAFAEIGPPLPACRCFGALAELGEAGRSALAWLLLGVSLLGLSCRSLGRRGGIA